MSDPPRRPPRSFAAVAAGTPSELANARVVRSDVAGAEVIAGRNGRECGEPPAQDPLDPDEERRCLLCLLNKITPTKFDRLCRRYLSSTRLFGIPPDVGFDAAAAQLRRRCASAVAGRAADDARYGPTYARLCARLVEAEAGAGGAYASSATFRGILVDVLRHVLLGDPLQYIRGDDDDRRNDDGEPQYFDDGSGGADAEIPPRAEEMTPEEREAIASWKRVARKARYVGHARFVGELLGAGVVGEEEVRTLLEELLEGTLRHPGEKEGAGGVPRASRPASLDELKLEAFASMLSSSGARLEELDRSCSSSLASRSTPKESSGSFAGGSADYYVGRAQALLEDHGRGLVRMSARSKFLLMDLIEKAENGWESTRGGNVAVATTLRQIRKDAMKVRPIR